LRAETAKYAHLIACGDSARYVIDVTRRLDFEEEDGFSDHRDDVSKEETDGTSAPGTVKMSLQALNVLSRILL
jgi:hypothetical protein